MRTTLPFLLAFLAASALPRVSAAQPRTSQDANRARATAPAGGGLPALAVTVDIGAAVVRTRTCPQGAGCTADGSHEATPITLDRAHLAAADEVLATATAIDIGDGRHLVHVRVQTKALAQSPRNLAWEGLFAAGHAAPIHAGLTGFVTGEIGERAGEMILTRERDGASRYVIKGAIREDLRICGHAAGTPLGPEMLDAKTLKWAPVGLQRLSVAQRDAARRIAAVPKPGAADRPIAQLLRATGTSGSSRGTALTDGDPATAWTEEAEGEGRGEFVVIAAPAEVPITRFSVAVPPGKSGSGPQIFYLVTDTQTLEVSLPEARSAPDGVYEIPLPEPIRTSCVALVLEQAYGSAARPDVAVRELHAYSEFDAPGGSLEAVAKALGGPRSPAASALLKLGKEDALKAVEGAFDSLDRSGRIAALEVAVGNGSCAASAGLLARVMAEGERQLSRIAREKLVRCGPESMKALVSALRGPEKARIAAAPLLAQLDPVAALEPLLAVLGDGSPKARAAVRSGLATALRAAQPAQIAALLEVADRPQTARLDLVRAAQARLGEVAREANATIAALSQGASMATRYVLVPPVAEMARAGDAAAMARLDTTLTSDPDWGVRAAAAEAAAGIQGAGAALVRAAEDQEPRVREAAFAALGAGPLAGTAVSAALARVHHDGWSFVRVAALAALARAPRSLDTDATIVHALADASVRVRVATARTLGARRASTAGEALLARMVDQAEDVDVRESAARALGDVCHMRATDALAELARAASLPMANEVQIRTGLAAIDALGKLHPSDFRSRLDAALKFATPQRSRELASRAVARPGACP